MLEVSYEAILADPTGEIGKVAAFLDLPWRPALSAHVHAAAPTSAPPLTLHPRVRALCDDLHLRLEQARTARASRSAPST